MFYYPIPLGRFFPTPFHLNVRNCNGSERNCTGSAFNKFYKDTKFYKFLNDDLIHNDFEYKLGLNIDTLPFNPHGECDAGGLYFCEESKCHLYWKRYGTKVAIVKIPDDARVHIETNKFKADKLEIVEIIDYENMIDDFWIKISQHDHTALKYIKQPTQEMCKKIIENNTFAQRVTQTEELCKLAVQYDSKLLRYVNIQTEEICKLAVQQHGYTLELVKNEFKTEEICLLAVKSCGSALQYVNEQTEKICKLAVQNNGLALEHVKDQFQTEEICKLAVQNNGLALQYVKDLMQSLNKIPNLVTERLCELAVQNDGNTIQYLKKEFKTDEMCKLAVQQNGLALLHIRIGYRTEEICKIAVQQNGLALKYVDYQTDEICKLAVQQDSKALQYVNSKS